MKSKGSVFRAVGFLALSLLVAAALPTTYSAQNKRAVAIDDIMKLKTIDLFQNTKSY